MYSTTVFGLGTKGAINIVTFHSKQKLLTFFMPVMPRKRLFSVGVFGLRRILRSFESTVQGIFPHRLS
jgi:hypothetical protein